MVGVDILLLRQKQPNIDQTDDKINLFNHIHFNMKQKSHYCGLVQTSLWHSINPDLKVLKHFKNIYIFSVTDSWAEYLVDISKIRCYIIYMSQSINS